MNLTINLLRIAFYHINLIEDSPTIFYYSKGRDNEDIELGRTVFDLWASNPNLSFTQFKNLVINQTNIDDNAVNNLFDYLNTNEYPSVKSNPPAPNSIYDNTVSRTISINTGSYLDADAKQYYEYINKDRVHDATKSWDFGNQENQYFIYNNNSLINTLYINSSDYDSGIMAVPYSGIGASNTTLEVKANRYYPTENINRTSSTGKIFYMPLLKQINFDNSDLNFSAYLYPNPCENSTSLNINSSFVSDFNIKIINILGAEVYTQSANTFFIGQNEIKLNTSNLSSGCYTIIVDFNDVNNIKRLLRFSLIKN